MVAVGRSSAAKQGPAAAPAFFSALEWLPRRLRREPVTDLPAALQALATPTPERLQAASQRLHIIVVLGVPNALDGSLSRWQAARVEQALAAANADAKSLLIVSGGPTGAGGIPRAPRYVEADTMADALFGAGIAPGRLFVERRALTTVDNAAFVADIWNNELGGTARLGQLTIVAEPFHGVRALRIFAALLRDEVAAPLLRFSPSERLPPPLTWPRPPADTKALQLLRPADLLNLSWVIEQHRRVICGF